MNRFSAPFALLLLCARAAHAVDPETATVSAARDNSFLIEEAYNQEYGVVQHLLITELDVESSDDRSTQLSFGQEWPLFSGDHQGSFTLPAQWIEGDGETASGIGDLELAYRYQLLRETPQRPAIAPSLQLSVPTGDEDDGLGNGSVGYGFTLPISKVLADRWCVHGNAGVSYVPDVDGADLDDYSVGASVVYAVDRDLNLLLEWVAAWEQQVDDGHSDRDFASRLSPGARYAVDVFGRGQLVLGLAAPIGLTPDSPDWGLFGYVSFEHRLWQ
jgi:hypothetical protein